jgi:hypothetical protein
MNTDTNNAESSLSFWTHFSLPRTYAAGWITTTIDLIDEHGDRRPYVVREDCSILRLERVGAASIASFSTATRIKHLQLSSNVFADLPEALTSLTELETLGLTDNRLTALPPLAGRLTSLTCLSCPYNRLSSVSREIAQLRLLKTLKLDNNELETVPSQLGKLRALTYLSLHSNRLRWVPCELDLLPADAEVFLDQNPLAIAFRKSPNARHCNGENARSRLSELFSLTTHVGTIRSRATTVCCALHDLDLPALVTLEIIDELLGNDVRMWAKWELITAVKHFHQRRGIAE